MKYRGFAGAVIDASVRDTPQIRKLQFPVFSRGVAPSTTINHYRVTGVNVPVTCAGVRVSPGDIVTADEDGVAVVPSGEGRRDAQEVAGARRHGTPHDSRSSRSSARSGKPSSVTPGLWIGSGGLLGWICHVMAAFTAYSRARKKNRSVLSPRSGIPSHRSAFHSP